MMRSRIGQIGITVTCAVALALALVGCREEEQNRVLTYNKGVYAGKPDTPLTPANLQAMRDRMRYQGRTDSIGGPGGGSSGGTSAPDVRLPGSVLRARGENQRFN